MPESRRGIKVDGLITGWDWYATFVHGIAGLDATDREAAAASLPPLDSIDQWDYLMGRNLTAPRKSLAIGSTGNAQDTWASKNDIQVHGYIEAIGGKLWKLLVGGITNDIWQGPEYPNKTTTTQPDSNKVIHDCGFEPGCLFSLNDDEAEHNNVAAANPSIVRRLRVAMEAANKTVFAPYRPSSPHACAISLSKYHDPSHEFGWWGPFADHLTPDSSIVANTDPVAHE